MTNKETRMTIPTELVLRSLLQDARQAQFEARLIAQNATILKAVGKAGGPADTTVN
jgi:hypothetical protein